MIIYNRTNWVNSPSTDTAITAARLNNMEQGIVDCVGQLNSGSVAGSAKQLIGVFRDASAEQFHYNVFRSNILIADSIRNDLELYGGGTPSNSLNVYEITGWAKPDRVESNGRTVHCNYLEFPTDTFNPDIYSGNNFINAGYGGTWRSIQGNCYVANPGSNWFEDLWGSHICQSLTDKTLPMKVSTYIEAYNAGSLSHIVNWQMSASMLEFTSEDYKITNADLNDIRIFFTIYLEQPLLNGLG